MVIISGGSDTPYLCNDAVCGATNLFPEEAHHVLARLVGVGGCLDAVLKRRGRRTRSVFWVYMTYRDLVMAALSCWWLICGF